MLVSLYRALGEDQEAMVHSMHAVDSILQARVGETRLLFMLAKQKCHALGKALVHINKRKVCSIQIKVVSLP